VLRILKASLCVLLVCCVVHVYKAEVFASKVASAFVHENPILYI